MVVLKKPIAFNLYKNRLTINLNQILIITLNYPIKAHQIKILDQIIFTAD